MKSSMSPVGMTTSMNQTKNRAIREILINDIILKLFFFYLYNRLWNTLLFNIGTFIYFIASLF